jgi:NADP-dependent 3-hydroxy acid dehydrogenase YdfG
MKTILVTGATSGLGLAIAQSFVANGWTVIGLGRSHTRLADMQLSLGNAFIPFAVDISNVDMLGECFEQILLRFPALDVLVNNAAIFKLADFDQCTVKDIDQMIDTNLKGPMYCTYFAMKHLKQGSSRIINISSVAGTHGIKRQAIYCASKFGLEGFGQALGQELGDRGISLTTISPGGMDTPLWSEDLNPYPGGTTENLIKPRDIVRLIEEIIGLPSNVTLKNLVVFPSNEWH